MAEAFIQIILKRISSLIEGEIGLVLSAEKEMNKLTSILTTIQAVLEDAENRQLENPPIRDWLLKLNRLIYEIDDILDECTTEFSILKNKNSLGRVKKILFQHKIGRRMKQVTEKLDVVAAERAKFHLREIVLEKSNKQLMDARETTSFLNDTDPIYGRDAEKDRIVDILVNQIRDNQEVSVLPIVGLGGLGKTTLAQLVFKDPRVVNHFDTKLWAYVSQDFNLKNLVNAITESGLGRGSPSDLESRLEASEKPLLNLLNQKRYLLVLDDVWNEDPMKWSKLRNYLVSGSIGSAVIVTTRTGKVAELMRTLPPVNLKELTEENCWMLLQQQAFGKEEEGKYPKLEAIGRQIVKKCSGVPLAAKALGGLLRFTRTEKEWIRVNVSELWNLPQDETEILPALRLSYHHLPLTLRQCLAYWAVFPKGTEIWQRDLIFHWMAHGYISSSETSEAEDEGNHVWNELVARSLFHIYYHDRVGRYTSCTMHDFVHDLARSIFETKFPGVELQKNSTVREVNLSRDCVTSFPPSNEILTGDISLILKNHNHLRVLNASDMKIQLLPSVLGNMKHLRHLNLARSRIRTLPKALCNLWNLQTLNLEFCRELVGLPKNTRYLKNLRHLLLGWCYSLSETPPKIRELTSLKTLGMFIVGHDRDHQLEELKCLNLGGRLEIGNLERVQNPLDAKKANLAGKSNLHELVLSWESEEGISEPREDIDEKVFEALEPHTNLKSLRIEGFSGRHFPCWMGNSTLENLVEIDISYCQKLVQLHKLETLPCLKSLSLFYLDEVEYIGEGGNTVSRSFPSLESLYLSGLYHLKRLLKEESKEMFPSLQELSVEYCPMLVLPPVSSFNVKQLKKWNCDRNVDLSSGVNCKHLKVNIDENTKHIPMESLQRLTQLEHLHLKGAHEQCLPEGGLQVLKPLQLLEISDSNSLTGLPMGWLHDLSIQEDTGISDSKCLPSLRELWFNGLPKMVQLPEAIRNLSSLEQLILMHLPQLASLPNWLSELTSLHTLSILDCPKLASFPDSIQGMSNLRCLQILHCLDLEKRCEEPKGEDWHKISHISRLQFGR